MAFMALTMEEDKRRVAKDNAVCEFPVLDLDTACKAGGCVEEHVYCDDSDSEYYTASSDDNSDDREMGDDDDMSDDSDIDDESDDSDDGEITDDSKGMTESDTSESDTCDDSESTDGYDSSDESECESSDDREENSRPWSKTSRCNKHHYSNGDDLCSKLSNLKLKEEYTREGPAAAKANHQFRKGCSDTKFKRGKKERVECTYIYIMTDNCQRFKVGRSEKPLRRLRELSTGNVDLKLLDCFLVSSKCAESVAHRALAVRHRNTREWFYGTYKDIKSVVFAAIRTYLL